MQVYKLLLKKYDLENFLYQKLDSTGNNVLHYAATYGEHIKPWPVPGAALQMQWEIKWHEVSIEKNQTYYYYYYYQHI